MTSSSHHAKQNKHKYRQLMETKDIYSCEEIFIDWYFSVSEILRGGTLCPHPWLHKPKKPMVNRGKEYIKPNITIAVFRKVISHLVVICRFTPVCGLPPFPPYDDVRVPYIFAPPSPTNIRTMKKQHT